jgi:hypothetical protein
MRATLTILLRSSVVLSLALLVTLPGRAAEPFSFTIPGAVSPLPYRVNDAEFSTALNSIISVSDSPAQLHLHDPDTSDHFHVNLPLTANCVSVSPDGLQAVVGHNAWISVVDLSARTLTKSIAVPFNVTEIVHGGNGFAYTFAYSSARSINLATEAYTEVSPYRTIYSARLHPAGDRIYGADRNVSPDDVTRFSMAGGPITTYYDSKYHGDYYVCGDVWISNDGLRLVTACGNTFRAANDPSSDMSFAGNLSQAPRISWALGATGSTIVLPAYTSAVPRMDNEVHYYTPDAVYRGKALLPSYVTEGKTSASRGRRVFSNAAESRQYVIVQADTGSGIVADYGVVTIDCTSATTTLDPDVTTVSATAQTVQVDVTRNAACGWKAVSSASWIQTTSGGVGDGTVILNVAANDSGSSRNATVSIGGATFSLTQTAPPAAAAPAREMVTLPFRVIDAEYSKVLDAIVAVSDSPNALQIYDPVTQSLRSVALAATPTSVSVRPDGLFAAVGHNGTISYVDLVNASLVTTLNVSTNVLDIVLAGNGYVYAFPRTDQWETIRCVHIASNTETQHTGNSIYAGTLGRLHPGGAWIYGAINYVSPADIEKYDISPGTAMYLDDSPYHGDYSMCGNLWFSEDGNRIYTACGNVFRSTNVQATDMTYAGALEDETGIRWASNSQAAGWTAVLPKDMNTWWDPVPRFDHEIHYFTPDFLAYRGKSTLPSFVVESTSWQARGRWHFYDASGLRQYVVTQADPESGILYDFGVLRIDCTNATVSLDANSTTIGFIGGNVAATVTGADACGWKAVSNAAWINTLSSGVGNGTLYMTVSQNTTFSPRTGTVNVGGTVYTIQQTAAAVASLVATATSPTSVSLTWSFPATASHYEVWRVSSTGSLLVGSPAVKSFTDATASADTAYIYKVRAVMADASMSPFASDYANTLAFTDSSLVGTPIRAVHVTELRLHMNTLLQLAGQSAITFTDEALVGVNAKQVHITELRDAIAALRSSLGLSPLSFSSLPPDSQILAYTTTELRSALQ